MGYVCRNKARYWLTRLVAALSEVRGLAIQLGLHRESSYKNLGTHCYGCAADGIDPVQTELRRRVFQTAFMVDKSA
jgi:hypothetical protein